MAGFSTANTQYLTRTNVWSPKLKEVFEDELYFTRYIDWITDFPDGDTLNIASIGQAEVLNYDEGQAIRYSAMDTGNLTFTISKYKSSATYITEKMKQDGFNMSRLTSAFVPKMHRAIAKAMEVDALAVGPDAQTASNVNSIFGADHRWVGGGTNETISPVDFAKALNSLQMASVPATNLVAIVHPSVEYTLNTMTNLVNVSNNPRWEGIIGTGHTTGMKFIKNIYGFDVYTSLNLKTVGAETIGGRTTASTAVGNLFFSATPDALPFIGAVRQPPKVDSEYNKDQQREEYIVTCRYDFKVYRPEAYCTVITDIDQVV